MRKHKPQISTIFNFSWWKTRIYHFVFIISLVALSLLVAWWAVFIHRSVQQEYELHYEKLMMGLDLYAFTLGHNKERHPMAGVLKDDQRYEIHAMTTSLPSNKIYRRLIPYWDMLLIRPTSSYLLELKNQRKRRSIMVIGETSLLGFLILISGFMIYRMVWLERRTTHELHQLWSRVSHEIKTPITGLKIFLETLLREPLTREEMVPLTHLALKQVERQRKLAENMLTGQKLKKRGTGIKLKAIDLQEFINTYFQDHPLKLSGSPSGKVKIIPADSEKVIVKGDSEALHIIFDNLTDNAVKYGGQNLELTVEIKKQSKHTLVIFSDNGPGIDPKMKENIFAAFGRLETDLPAGQHGTGMGLHISRQLARGMGGDLSAESQGKGQGAQFILNLKTKNDLK